MAESFMVYIWTRIAILAGLAGQRQSHGAVNGHTGSCPLPGADEPGKRKKLPYSRYRPVAGGHLFPAGAVRYASAGEQDSR